MVSVAFVFVRMCMCLCVLTVTCCVATRDFGCYRRVPGIGRQIDASFVAYPPTLYLFGSLASSSRISTSTPPLDSARFVQEVESILNARL